MAVLQRHRRHGRGHVNYATAAAALVCLLCMGSVSKAHAGIFDRFRNALSPSTNGEQEQQSEDAAPAEEEYNAGDIRQARIIFWLASILKRLPPGVLNVLIASVPDNPRLQESFGAAFISTINALPEDELLDILQNQSPEDIEALTRLFTQTNSPENLLKMWNSVPDGEVSTYMVYGFIDAMDSDELAELLIDWIQQVPTETQLESSRQMPADAMLKMLRKLSPEQLDEVSYAIESGDSATMRQLVAGYSSYEIDQMLDLLSVDRSYIVPARSV